MRSRLDLNDTSVGRRRMTRILPYALLVLVPLAWIGGIFWDAESESVVRPSDLVWGASFLAFPVVGSFLAARFPRNAIGWMLLAGPSFVGFGVTLIEYSEAVGSESAGYVGETLFAIGLLVIGSALLLFPDGRYPNRGFAVVHLALIATLVLVDNEKVDGASLGGFIALVIGALLYRLIRGSPIVRRQMAPPLLVGVAGIAIISLTEQLVPSSAPALVSEWMGVLASTTISIGIPVAIAVSISRYRLYEVERIVSRTVSYALVAGLLGVVFGVGIAWLPTAVHIDSSSAVAGTTLVVAALFNPFRRRVQALVDRRFNRSRYDSEMVMAQFADSLRDRVDPEELVEGWAGVVFGTMQPERIGMWVRDQPGRMSSRSTFSSNTS